ncbi:MAG: hypothetical protein GY816_15210 [Cytophagales bacterium]|nr:hypothetical protein [Cytophagales bacterium]
MNSKIRAVITGDIVGSTKIAGDYQEVLHQIDNDIKQYKDDSFILDIYRGDSFQSISNKPAKGLLILLILKAGMKRYSSKKGSKEMQWDARMSLGIGFLEEYPESNNLRELSGDPFTKSGRNLDQMKEKGRLIHVSTGDEKLDDEIFSVTPLIEAVTNRWSTAQADAIYQLLLKNLTQYEIGKELGGKSQRAIGKRLEASNVDSIKPYLSRFEKQIAWTFNI